MREQLSMQLSHAQHAQNTVDSSAGKIESIVRILEATWHRTWNLPRRQPCRSPGQEALPSPSDRLATHARRTTWRLRVGSSCPPHVPAPQLTRKQTASKAGSPARRASRAAGRSGSTRAARWPGGRCRGSAFRLPSTRLSVPAPLRTRPQRHRPRRDHTGGGQGVHQPHRHAARHTGLRSGSGPGDRRARVVRHGIVDQRARPGHPAVRAEAPSTLVPAVTMPVWPSHR